MTPSLRRSVLSTAPVRPAAHCRLGQSLATFDHAHNGVDQVFEMQKGLTVGDMTGKHFARNVTFVDALDLMRQRNGVTVIVIHPGNSQDSRRIVPPFGLKHPLRLHF
mgnify:CR=1 FL=1